MFRAKLDSFGTCPIIFISHKNLTTKVHPLYRDSCQGFLGIQNFEDLMDQISWTCTCQPVFSRTGQVSSISRAGQMIEPGE